MRNVETQKPDTMGDEGVHAGDGDTERSDPQPGAPVPAAHAGPRDECEHDAAEEETHGRCAERSRLTEEGACERRPELHSEDREDREQWWRNTIERAVGHPSEASGTSPTESVRENDIRTGKYGWARRGLMETSMFPSPRSSPLRRSEPGWHYDIRVSSSTVNQGSKSRKPHGVHECCFGTVWTSDWFISTSLEAACATQNGTCHQSKFGRMVSPNAGLPCADEEAGQSFCPRHLILNDWSITCSKRNSSLTR